LSEKAKKKGDIRKKGDRFIILLGSLYFTLTQGGKG
jgi:hypothetical protein